MSKIITTIETTPEELVSRISKAVDKRIETLHNENQKVEKPVKVPEVSQFLGNSQNWTRREAKAGRIPAHRRTTHGDFYFFLSEIIAWIKEGRIVSNDELMQKANDYANSKTY
jgi:predicted DNA-binding transcriptional regulator AlpA